ncbi:MAG: aminotransferase class IV [Dehalococcoidia bacterium]|nr:aminotransferase class IV [Dehalococcoidia bacterium]
MDEVRVKKVYFNGSMVPLSGVRVSPFDYGFLYGYGLFETMRAYNGVVFRLEDHLNRLMESARVLKFSAIPDTIKLSYAISETLEVNGLKDARIRLNYSIGEGAMVPDPDTCKEPVTLISAQEYTPLSGKIYETGYSAILSSFRRDSLSVLSRLKTGNYLNSLLARREARKAGADEALMLNEKGHLTECSSSNLFLVLNEILYTAPAESGLLPGITRQVVLELAAGLNMDVRIQEIPVDFIKKAQEAFLTNSIMEIMPLTSFMGQPVGMGKPGPITKKLRTAYSSLTLAP